MRLSEDIKQLLIQDEYLISTMPGGFENSSMKSSFSLSSLPPSSNTLESPEHAALHDRPYSSLRKKPRKDPEIDSWRRSWGSREANKDEFWAALENNYQYLMDNNLIDSCQEARRDLQYGASPTHEWSFEQFTTQFNELDAWLNSIHDAMHNKTESVIARKLRLSHMEELQRKTYKRKLFNNQGGRLVARSPDLKTEVARKIRYLNKKWEMLENVVTPRKRTYPDLPDICPDVEQELRCLRKWIKTTEDRLPPLNLHHKWTSQEIEEKTKEHEAISKDVWAHGRIVGSVVRLCERLSTAEEDQAPDTSISSWVRGRRVEPSQAANFARSLERRWQLLYLGCLERQCHLDQQRSNLLKKQDSSSSIVSVESDEEPVRKIRKLFDSPTQPPDENLDDVDSSLMEVAEEGGVKVNTVCQMEIETAPELAKSTIDGGNYLPPLKFTPETIRKRLLNESSKFTKSSRMGKNCATVYFRHKDTDTEGVDGKSAEESSEEEWTYEGSQVPQQPEQLQPEIIIQPEPEKKLQEPGLLQPERPDHEVIQRLVEEAEEIVASPVRTRPGYKYPRVEEWLHHQYPEKAVGDSCDASGEYTSEDDALEARIEEVTESIQDLDTTLVNQTDISIVTPEQPKVIMRVKKRDGGGQRPWSVSGSMGTHDQNDIILPHSISESAIHQLGGTPTHCGGKMDSSLHAGSTLSSSTVEDTTQTQEGSGGGYSSNSLRRRKIKLRKRNMRKSESGSEGLLAQSDATTINSSPSKLPLSKSGPRRLSYDKAFESTHRRHVLPVESPVSTSATSEEESEGSVKIKQKLLQMPAFRIGPAHTLSSYAADRKERVVVSNDSSYSEQAWDSYQEKYMSEAYSEEPVDAEAAKRLLEFGDDYRNFLDSQSDCASSLGRMPLSRRPRAKVHHGVESDNDLEDVWHLVHKSNNQLLFSEQVFNTLSRASPHLVLASDFAELIATCRENVRCLRVLLDKIEEDTALLSEQECKDIRGLIDRWDALAKGSDDLQMCRSLRREISALKEEILEVSDRTKRLDTKLTDRDQLEMRINEIKKEASRLKEVKSQVHQVNVAVHRFLTDSGHQDTTLKEEVAQLYGIWEDTHHRLTSEESHLEQTRSHWCEFDSNLAVLECALRSDSETLRILDEALASDGGLSPSLASSARDLAKRLNEHLPLTEPQTTDEMTGGSLSDSGISDSGSEQDLSERERRLAALRRLARHLEAVLAPGSAAILSMAKRIEATENELRGLQRTCRELIVRTAVCAEAKGPLPTLCSQRPPNTRSPEGGEKRNGWLWRVIRAAFPFQLALMALFCIACLLEPHCCDSMNSLTISISPQLRYIRGPPPV